MDEPTYFAAQQRKSDSKISWEYGRLLRLAGLGPVRGKRVVDAGCGAGPGLRFFAALGNAAVGLDRSFYALQRARELVPQAALLQGDLSDGIPLAAEGVDLVVLGDVLEHLAEGERLLQECCRVLRPGGAVLLRTVNRWDIRRCWQGRRWSGRADPTHRRLYSPLELGRALRQAGFVRVRVRAGVKPMLWLPVRWPVGLPWPPWVGNALMGAGFKMRTA